MVVPEFNAEYKSLQSNTIFCRCQNHTLLRSKQAILIAKFKYIAVPKIEENVYPYCCYSRWNTKNFLGGEANIFLNKRPVSQQMKIIDNFRMIHFKDYRFDTDE